MFAALVTFGIHAISVRLSKMILEYQPNFLTEYCHAEKVPIYFNYTAAIDSLTLNNVKTYKAALILMKTNINLIVHRNLEFDKTK